jgi:hypothetical protein
VNHDSKEKSTNPRPPSQCPLPHRLIESCELVGTHVQEHHNPYETGVKCTVLMRPAILVIIPSFYLSCCTLVESLLNNGVHLPLDGQYLQSLKMMNSLLGSMIDPSIAASRIRRSCHHCVESGMQQSVPSATDKLFLPVIFEKGTIIREHESCILPDPVALHHRCIICMNSEKSM